jgi:hypothetical protein
MDFFDAEYGVTNLSTTLPPTTISTNFSFDNFTVFTDFPNKIQHNPTEYCNPVNMDEFNCSIEQYLIYARGSKQQPLFIALPVSYLKNNMIYLFRSDPILSIAGNIKKNENMHHRR